ncbi:MAG: acetylornithine deacetylase [Myxococcaceae bacterium]
MSATLEQLQRTLADLVAIDSTSTRSNTQIIAYLEERLRSLGFTCERHTYRDSSGTEKVNLLGTRGEGRPELALVGHSDCVPFDPAWTDALKLTEANGRLYGRGACDTKGFISAALVALSRFSAAEQKKPLMALFTADEELGCVGAKQLVDAGVGRARFAIVGEPTSLTPIRANKGYCLAEIDVIGKEGHSAYPDTGANAIFHAARFLRRLEDAASHTLRVEQDAAFEPPYTTVNVGTIQGGKAKNVIPGLCRFVVEWRPIPSQPVERVSELLQSLAAELRNEDPKVNIEVRLLRMDRGVDTSPDSEVVRFMANESGKTPETVAFGTEAPQLTQLGAQAVVFGPGDIRVAHQTGEFVPVDELVKCEEILGRALRHFCG